MADEELQLDVNQSKGSKMTNILLIVLILLVLALGGAGAWYFFFKGNNTGDNAGKTEKVEKAPLHYLDLKPEFVVNFGPGSKVRYLQVDLQAATRDEHALAVMNTYMPVIRNDILLLLSGQSYDILKTRAGKEELQKKILDKLNSVITAETAEQNGNPAAAAHGDANGEQAANKHGTGTTPGPIENVYFTSFIMQ